MPIQLDFPYLDERLVMVNKPHGVVCHRSATARDKLTLHFLVNERVPGKSYLVNRLDRGTSGIIVLGRDKEAARHCSLAFQERKVSKTYLALVRGWPPEDEFECRRELDGKPARTLFKVLGRTERPWPKGPHESTRLSFLEITPKSGIFHQIRRHLLRLKHPISGDREHGDKQLNRVIQEHCGIRRLILHSWRLGLPHPDDGRWIEVTAPFPGRLRGMLARLGFEEEMIQLLRPE